MMGPWPPPEDRPDRPHAGAHRRPARRRRSATAPSRRPRGSRRPPELLDARTRPRSRARRVQAPHRTVVALARRSRGEGERALRRARGRRSARSSTRSGCIRRATARASVPTACVHQRFRAWKEALRDHAPVTSCDVRSDTSRARCAPTVNSMERQAGWAGAWKTCSTRSRRSSPTDSAHPRHVLFGIALRRAPPSPTAHPTTQHERRSKKKKDEEEEVGRATRRRRRRRRRRSPRASRRSDESARLGQLVGSPRLGLVDGRAPRRLGPGRNRHASSAPTTATAAVTSDARDIAYTNDSRAASASGAPTRPSCALTCSAAPTDWSAASRTWLGTFAGSLRVEVGRVERRQHAADDGDAERATDLTAGVVDRGADAGLVQRERAHDRLGRRRDRQAHARAHQHHRHHHARVARSRPSTSTRPRGPTRTAASR